MSASKAQAMIGRVAVELTELPEEDLPLVIEFVDYLKRRQQPHVGAALADIRVEARRRAQLLREVPNEDIVERFKELAEDIRQEAMQKGTALEGDVTSD